MKNAFRFLVFLAAALIVFGGCAKKESTISILPVLIAFLCAQNAFVKGIALSGLKD